MRPSKWVRVFGAAMVLWSFNSLWAQDTLVPGEMVFGTLSADDESLSYVFPGTAGDLVSVTLRSRAFDPLLYILFSDGTEVAQNDDTEGSLNSAITGLILPLDDDYTVVVDSPDDQAVGAFELELAYNGIQTIEYGDVIEGEITAAAPTELYQFAGSAEDSISIGLYSDYFDAYLTLSDSETEIATDDDGGGNTNALINLTLPADGTYTIQAKPLYEGVSGPFRLELETVTITPLIPGEPSVGELAGKRLYYSFEADAGDQITLRVDAAPDLDSEFRVSGPQGYFLGVDDDSGLGLNPEFNNMTADFGGTFTLSLYTVGDSDGGPFTLTLSIVEPSNLAFDDPLTIDFFYKHYQQAFRFDGKAGDVFRLKFQPVDVEIPNLSVRVVQNDTELTSTYIDGTTVDMSVEAEIPADGEVHILLADYDYRGNTYEMRLERVENPADEG